MYAQGKFTLILRDAETLEEKSVIEKENTITSWAEWRMHRNHGMLSSSHSGYWDDINISNQLTVPGIDLNRNIGSTYGSGSNLKSPTWFPATDETPAYLEFAQRFNPTTSVREINTIFIGNGTSYDRRAWAYAGLTNPCYQGTTEVLDVYYRIQFFRGTAEYDEDYYSITSYYEQLMYEMPARGSGEWNGTPIHAQPFYAQPPKKSLAYYSMARLYWPANYSTGIHNISSRSWDDTNWMTTHSYSRGTGSEVGMMCGMLSYGYESSSGQWLSTLTTPYVPKDFAYKPVQPIHRHNNVAPVPFLDVDYLASSTGLMNVNGDNWDETHDFPEFQRIDFLSTGSIGEGRYAYATRKLLNFWGNSFRQDLKPLPFQSGRFEAVNGGHGTRYEYSYVEFDAQSYILSDDTGITVMNAANGDVENYDAGTTPALPITQLSQVCSQNQVIFVGCADTGLYKIEHVFNDETPTVITHLSNALAGVPEGGCYGVDIGYQGKLFAVFNGAMGYSVDKGASWTLLDKTTTPKFDQDALEASITLDETTWLNCRSIHIDRESPDNQMLIKYYDPEWFGNNRCRTSWWNEGDGESYQGANFDWNLVGDHGRSRLARIRCSRYGSFWVGCNNFPYKLTPNTANADRIGSGSDYARVRNAVFFYDSYMQPYYMSYVSGDSTFFHPALYDKDRIMRGGCDVYAGYGYRTSYNHGASSESHRLGTIFTWEENGGNGVYLLYKGWFQSSGYNHDQFRITTVCPASDDGYGVSWDSWNGKGTVHEDMVWDKYGWNGSEWVKGYLMPAVDQGTNGNNGVRKNFKAGNPEFHGNAIIESPVFSQTSDWTLAATLTFDSRQPYVHGPEAGVFASVGNTVTNTQFTFGMYDDEPRFQFANRIIRVPSIDDADGRYVFSTQVQSDLAMQYGAANVKWRRYGSDYSSYDYATNTWRMDSPYHSSSQREYGSALMLPVEPLKRNDFKVRFKRTVSGWYGGNNANEIISYSHGTFSLWLWDGDHEDVTYHTGGGYHARPYPASSASGTSVGRYIAIAFAYTDARPQIYTQLDSNNDTTSPNKYTNMTTHSAFVADDWNGTNDIDVNFVHNGTTYDIEIWSTAPDADPVLKYSGTANGGGVNVSRPVAKPQIILHYNAGYRTTGYHLIKDLQVLPIGVDDFYSTSDNPVMSIYKDGELFDQCILPESLNADSFNIGGESGRYGDASKYHNFFRGTAANIQLWNLPFTYSDATYDMERAPLASNLLPSANLLAHYANTYESLADETKVTHSGVGQLTKGLTVEFDVGASEPSIVQGDWFSYGVINGILKDNAISISNDYRYYTKRIKDLTDIENPNYPGQMSPTVPATYTPITDHVTWVNPRHADCRPGRVTGTYYGNYDNWGHYGSQAWGYQGALPAQNASYTFRMGQSPYSNIMSGFAQRPDGLVNTSWGNGYNFINWAFHHMTNGLYRIYEAGTHRSEFPDTPYTAGDKFEVRRTGTLIEYFHNDELVYTSAVASADYIWPAWCCAYSWGSCIYDCQITYTPQPHTLYLGNSLTRTGRWDDDHLLMDATDGKYVVKVNGNEQLVTLVWNERMTTMPDPLDGEVVISRQAGIIKFPAAHAGLPVEINYRTINKK